MYYFLVFIFIIVSILLIVSIILQNNVNINSLNNFNVLNNNLLKLGENRFLFKLTYIFGILFFILSLILANINKHDIDCKNNKIIIKNRINEDNILEN